MGGRTAGDFGTEDNEGNEGLMGKSISLRVCRTLSLLRIWPRRVRGLVVMIVFPVSLVVASFVAAYEEKLFMEEHAEGVGPTSRWTVSNHWLAYDAETKRLSGSD